jgi:hypothetical protein
MRRRAMEKGRMWIWMMGRERDKERRGGRRERVWVFVVDGGEEKRGIKPKADCI